MSMNEYSFDLPHDDAEAFEHIRFLEACAQTVRRYTLLEPRHRIDYAYADGKITILSQSQNAERVLKFLEKVCAEFFDRGRSPTYCKLQHDITALRDELDAKATLKSDFEEAAEKTGLSGYIDIPDLGDRQKTSLKRLQSFLRDHDITTEICAGRPQKIRITCTSENDLEIGKLLMTWALDKIKTQSDISEGSIEHYYKRLLANDNENSKKTARRRQPDTRPKQAYG